MTKFPVSLTDLIPQILRADHWCLVSGLIRDQINRLDAKATEDEKTTVDISKHISLGAPQRPRTLQDLEDNDNDKRSFRNFRNKLVMFFKRFVQAHNIPIPNGQPIAFNPNALVGT
jgi:hypothetical protein